MHCLKPKVGSGNILEDTTSHLPPDEIHFPLCDVIAGPLHVFPKGSTRLEVWQQTKKALYCFKTKQNRLYHLIDISVIITTIFDCFKSFVKFFIVVNNLVFHFNH